MEPRSPRRFPSPPAALSPSPLYLIVPRAPLLRFRRSPPSLPVGIVPAPSSSLSAVAAEFRFAAVVAPDLLPLRHRLHRLRRVLVDLVRSSVSPADRRSAAVSVHPNRAAAFSRFGIASIGFAASSSTSSAPPFRPPTAGAPPSPSTRTAPPPSPASAAVSVVAVDPG
ncbi:HGWP repeat containing protein-like [Oryza sativa Japonica Group]|uniref:HGWP repeat containing protein-like n=1 Tax=Oryza sativa subsp. japonica TaxID=39947 RepID=Q5ZB37_ORYSJ|nr:HGWP repeat containing protein-like [Oryza sativa Japonica Group]BAD53186.1 HGWP repeat containing protein-like [Oryza sativa Japonica Group]